MKLKVAVYDSHEKAVKAISVLSQAHFPMKEVSLIGKSEIVNDHIQIKSTELIKDSPALIGAGAGTIVGLLTGLGVFAIPGFGFLYGAGAVIGAIGGFDLGLIAGGVGSILVVLGINKDKMVEYEEHLNEGKFMVVVSGTIEEVKKAEQILHTEGTHLELI